MLSAFVGVSDVISSVLSMRLLYQCVYLGEEVSRQVVELSEFGHGDMATLL